MDTLTLQQSRTAPWHRISVIAAAWVEIIVGISFILATDTQSQFVFGATIDGPGELFARFAGAALIALGIACLPSNDSAIRQAARTLLIFNIAATIFFASVGVASTLRGVMLWPVVILHAVLAIVLGLSLGREAS